MKAVNKEQTKACSLCGRQYTGAGYNPAPLSSNEEDRCCSECNASYVLPSRIMAVQPGDQAAKFVCEMAKHSVTGRKRGVIK